MSQLYLRPIGLADSPQSEEGEAVRLGRAGWSMPAASR